MYSVKVFHKLVREVGNMLPWCEKWKPQIQQLRNNEATPVYYGLCLSEMGLTLFGKVYAQRM